MTVRELVVALNPNERSNGSGKYLNPNTPKLGGFLNPKLS
jgi:hypothetical protein